MPKALRRPKRRALARNTTQLLAARLRAAATLSHLARAMREGADGPDWPAVLGYGGSK